MIRDDEIKCHGCSRLLSGWQLWKKKKKPLRIFFRYGLADEHTRDVSAPMPFNTTETKQRKPPTQIRSLVLEEKSGDRGLVPDVAAGRRGGGDGGAGGGRAKLGGVGGGGSLVGVYSSTWRALSLRLWNRRRLVLFFCAEQFTQPLASALSSPRS